MGEVIHGDCLDVLRGMEANSVDSIVTDPPYGLAFMGKRWDYDVPSVEIWAECLRVLKPGGHLLAFAGTRTQHRMAVRIEDAGFEIRDLIAWVYGSGFPKSHNGPWGGTALKPALEPITMARKPLVGTVAANVLAYGTGALNIDGCRVASPDAPETAAVSLNAGSRYAGVLNGGKVSEAEARVTSASHTGRWPANLIHDGSDEVLAGFPHSKDGVAVQRNRDGEVHNEVFGAYRKPPGADVGYGSQGSAARFFYCAKASKRDRDEGNNHPTVKPTDLMRYLCRLVTPAGGLVLDPFAGSGSTGKAAVIEGFRFVGIEREAEYVEIARARVKAATAVSGIDKSQFVLL